MFDRLWRWALKLQGHTGLKTVYVADTPERLASETIYIVGENNHYWCAAMLCPCGCGDGVFLSLVEEDYPSWKCKVDRTQRVTLVPSVWRTAGCRSHYFVRQGRVIWCRRYDL